MKNIRIIIFVGISAWFATFSTASASEILCTLGTAATSTGCVSVENNFVAFAPSATPPAGTYGTVQSVALSAENATNIHYTTDGTAPSCVSGTLYSVPISVKKTQTIKAIACYPQSTQSAVSSFEYLLSIFDASSENAVPTTVGIGKAALPTQATSVRLGNNTRLDISTSVNTASLGQVTIGGVVKNLSAFTNGNLVSVDLSAPISVGGQAVSVGKAVGIQSGVSGEPVVLSNQDFSSAQVSIPDGTTILASSGWDGTIAPPKAAARSGEAPVGFSVGGTIVEVGSGNSVLLFDKPVSVVLSGVTGATGYKTVGSVVWVQIANGCGGSYDAPSAPVFPGECFISNGTDTKIYTYHFTSFAALESGQSTVVILRGNGPAGFGASSVVGDMNGDGAIDIFDFNILFAVWGVSVSTGPFYAGADLNRDSKIDILDFNLLMLNWK